MIFRLLFILHIMFEPFPLSHFDNRISDPSLELRRSIDRSLYLAVLLSSSMLLLLLLLLLLLMLLAPLAAYSRLC